MRRNRNYSANTHITYSVVNVHISQRLTRRFVAGGLLSPEGGGSPAPAKSWIIVMLSY
jgi:hypothetical protein